MTEDEMARWHHRLDGHEFEPQPSFQGSSAVWQKSCRCHEAEQPHHAHGEGELVIILESWETARSSRGVALQLGPAG